jgi:hypothetical protein
MADDYDFRRLTHSDAELEEVSALLRRVFPQAPHLTPRYLAWLYRDNPDGAALGHNAYWEGRLVGHCAGQPLVAAVEGKAVRGILLVNAAAEARHLRRNITRRTTDPMFEQAAASGYAFAIAVGNANSTKPLLTRFRMVAPLEARVGLGLPRRRPRDFAPSFERLWSEEALRWRLANPEHGYRVREANDGIAILSPTRRRGVAAVLYDGADASGLTAGEARAPGPLRVWLGLDPAIDWTGSLYLAIPQRWRASPLNVVFKDLSGGSLHPDAARLIFRAIDFDAF